MNWDTRPKLAGLLGHQRRRGRWAQHPVGHTKPHPGGGPPQVIRMYMRSQAALVQGRLSTGPWQQHAFTKAEMALGATECGA